jgi:hypothetical protein
MTQIQASRYSVFNQLAQQLVQSQRFAQPTNVIVDFNYDPKVCASTVTAPNLPGLPSGNPAIPSSGNGSERVSPANDSTRNIPQLPPLLPGSNTPNPNSAPANSQRNTIQKTSPSSPTRILRPVSPATPQKPAIAPTPGSAPSETPTTTTNPSTPKTPSQNSPSPQNTQNSSLESLQKPKTQTQPAEQPVIKPTSSVDTPKAPSEVKPASTPDVQSSPTPTNESLLEKIRKTLFQPQSTKNQEATPRKPTPSSTESQKPESGSSGTMTNNNNIGPFVGKKE